MPDLVEQWLDVEGAFADKLAGLGETVTELPPTIAGHLPLIYVQRVGGLDEYVQVKPNVKVDVYAGSRADAWKIAESAARLLLKDGGFVARPVGDPAVAVSKVRSVSANTRLGYADPKIRLVTATYTAVAARDDVD